MAKVKFYKITAANGIAFHDRQARYGIGTTVTVDDSDEVKTRTRSLTIIRALKESDWRRQLDRVLGYSNGDSSGDGK